MEAGLNCAIKRGREGIEDPTMFTKSPSHWVLLRPPNKTILQGVTGKHTRIRLCRFYLRFYSKIPRALSKSPVSTTKQQPHMEKPA